MIVGDRLGDVLQQHGLAGARRRDDQRALALALRRDDVDHPRRLVLDRRIERVERQLLVRIERRQIVEIDAVADDVGIVEIDADQLGQREIALAVLGRADLAFDRVAGAQAEFADLVGRDIDVVGAGEIIGLGRAQEAEAVRQHLDRALAHDLLAILGLDLEDREHQVLLAQRRGALDASSSAISTSSAGIFFFKSLRCMEDSLGRFGMRSAAPDGRSAGKAARDGRLGERAPAIGAVDRPTSSQAPRTRQVSGCAGSRSEQACTITRIDDRSPRAIPGTSLISRSALPVSGPLAPRQLLAHSRSSSRDSRTGRARAAAWRGTSPRAKNRAVDRPSSSPRIQTTIIAGVMMILRSLRSRSIHCRLLGRARRRS